MTGLFEDGAEVDLDATVLSSTASCTIVSNRVKFAFGYSFNKFRLEAMAL